MLRRRTLLSSQERTIFLMKAFDVILLTSMISPMPRGQRRKFIARKASEWVQEEPVQSQRPKVYQGNNYEECRFRRK
jgi:hypothetical protein